jgi:hypothetical protein
MPAYVCNEALATMAEYFTQQVHHVRGRLRLKVPAIKRNEARARFAEQQLSTLYGVRSACANELTGSLVVRFDPFITNVEPIFDALKAHGLLDARAALPVIPVVARHSAAVAPSLSIPSRSLADVIVNKTLETLLERCALALVAALI